MNGLYITSLFSNGCHNINVVPRSISKLNFSELYLSRSICWIDIGQYFHPHVTFICCVNIVPIYGLTYRNLAKIRPINGLYATIVAPVVYAILGKTRRLAVLPEAALSLVIGEAIRQNIGKDDGGEIHLHIIKASEMACLITFLAALITFLAGIFRLGFVDIIGSPVRIPKEMFANEEAVVERVYKWCCYRYFHRTVDS
jgi:Sulfate permease family